MSGDGDAWDGSFDDEIQCPHCNAIDYEHTDYPSTLQLDGDRAETECSYCGKPMLVTLCASYTYATAPVPAPPADEGEGAGRG